MRGRQYVGPAVVARAVAVIAVTGSSVLPLWLVVKQAVTPDREASGHGVPAVPLHL